MMSLQGDNSLLRFWLYVAAFCACWSTVNTECAKIKVSGLKRHLVAVGTYNLQDNLLCSERSVYIYHVIGDGTGGAQTGEQTLYVFVSPQTNGDRQWILGTKPCSVSDALLRSVVDAGQPSEVPAGKWYEVTPPSEDGSLPSPSFNKDINVHCVEASGLGSPLVRRIVSSLVITIMIAVLLIVGASLWCTKRNKSGELHRKKRRRKSRQGSTTHTSHQTALSQKQQSIKKEPDLNLGTVSGNVSAVNAALYGDGPGIPV